MVSPSREISGLLYCKLTNSYFHFIYLCIRTTHINILANVPVFQLQTFGKMFKDLKSHVVPIRALKKINNHCKEIK